MEELEVGILWVVIFPVFAVEVAVCAASLARAALARELEREYGRLLGEDGRPS